MTELLGENIFSWVDLLTKSLQQMFCLRYGLASAVPKIYYFYGVAIFPIDNLVESLDDDASIQNRRTFKIPFGCANTGIVFEQLHCMSNLFNKTDTTNRTKFFVDVPRGITNFISGGVVDNDFFHTFTVSSSSTEAKFPLRISFSKSSYSSRINTSMSV